MQYVEQEHTFFIKLHNYTDNGLHSRNSEVTESSNMFYNGLSPPLDVTLVHFNVPFYLQNTEVHITE